MFFASAPVPQRRLCPEIADIFLKTDFEGGRHAGRVAKIMEQSAGAEKRLPFVFINNKDIIYSIKPNKAFVLRQRLFALFNLS